MLLFQLSFVIVVRSGRAVDMARGRAGEKVEEFGKEEAMLRTDHAMHDEDPSSGV